MFLSNLRKEPYFNEEVRDSDYFASCLTKII